MDVGNFSIFEGHFGNGIYIAGHKPHASDDETQLHAETARVCCAYQFLRIGADAVFEACFIRVLRVVEYRALGADGTFSVFPAALPVGACLSCEFHIEVALRFYLFRKAV